MRDPQRGEGERIDTTCCLPPDMLENDDPGNTFRYADGQLLVHKDDDPLVIGELMLPNPPPVRTELDQIDTVKYTGITVDVVGLADNLRTTYGARLNPNHYYRGAP